MAVELATRRALPACKIDIGRFPRLAVVQASDKYREAEVADLEHECQSRLRLAPKT
jgi:hypothetical protein